MKSLENIKKELETLKNQKLSEIELEELNDQHNQIINIKEEIREISDVAPGEWLSISNQL